MFIDYVACMPHSIKIKCGRHLVFSLKDFCADKALQRRLGTMFPPIVAGSCSHCERKVARRILAFDLEVTAIVNRDHLSINGERAKCINYFREKSFDFFVHE